MDIQLERKVCNVCDEEKIIHDFARTGSANNYRGTCKQCVRKNKKPNTYDILAKYQPDPRFCRTKKK